jgi:hypothetical protein
MTHLDPFRALWRVSDFLSALSASSARHPYRRVNPPPSLHLVRVFLRVFLRVSASPRQIERLAPSFAPIEREAP